MKCIGCLETSVRKYEPTLRNTQKNGGLNCTATKELNMPSVNGSHACELDAHTDTAEGIRLVDRTALTSDDMKVHAACVVFLRMWEVPPSAVIALRLYSLTTLRVFLRSSVDVPVQYLGIDLLLPHYLRFIIH